MPLEIRELIIRTQIVSDDDRSVEQNGQPAIPVDTQLLVDQCVEKVLKAIRKKMER